MQSDVAPDEIEEMLERTDVTLPVRRLMLAIYPGWLNILFERLRESDRKPDIADWRNVNRRLTYEFHRGWHYYLVLGISAGFTGLALAQIVWSLIDSFVVSNPWPWVYIASIPPIISVIGLFGWFDESFSLEAIELPVLRTLSGRNLRESASTYKFRPDVFLCAIIWGSIIYAVQSVILVFQDDRWIDRLWGPLLLLYLATPMVTVAIFASQFMLRFDLSFGAVGLVWLGAIAVGFALWRMGRREERRSRNPLQGILNSRIVSDNESSLQEQSFLSKKVER